MPSVRARSAHTRNTAPPHTAGRLRRGAASLALVLAACAVNPATGERQLVLMSEQQEIAVGREAAEQAESQIGVYDDAELGAYVREIGERLAARSERPRLPWSFQVADDAAINAFALPGGPIFVTRGILAHMRSEAELAGVLGHEIGHVTARHAVTRMSKAQIAQIGLGVGTVVLPELQSLGQVVGAGLGLLFLKYSRDDERQADDLGLRYVRATGYDPRAVADVLAMLDDATQAEGGGRAPGWLATHPNPAERVARIESQLTQAERAGRGGRTGEDAFLARLDGIVFGEDPRQGFFEDARFIHPELAFEMRFPEGWQLHNARNAVGGISPEGDAVVQVTLADAPTVSEAARRFFGSQEIAARGAWLRRIGGLPAVSGYFEASSPQGRVAGLAAFVGLDRRVYHLMAFTPASRLGARDRIFRASLGSFRRLTDADLLAARPPRLRIVTLPRAMSLEQLGRDRAAAAPLDEIALLNRVSADRVLPAGTRVKWVVPGR